MGPPKEAPGGLRSGPRKVTVGSRQHHFREGLRSKSHCMTFYRACTTFSTGCCYGYVRHVLMYRITTVTDNKLLSFTVVDCCWPMAESGQKVTTKFRTLAGKVMTKVRTIMINVSTVRASYAILISLKKHLIEKG